MQVNLYTIQLQLFFVKFHLCWKISEIKCLPYGFPFEKKEQTKPLVLQHIRISKKTGRFSNAFGCTDACRGICFYYSLTVRTERPVMPSTFGTHVAFYSLEGN